MRSFLNPDIVKIQSLFNKVYIEGTERLKKLSEKSVKNKRYDNDKSSIDTYKKKSMCFIITE